MHVTIIPDTGVNNIYVNAVTGRNVIVSGIQSTSSHNTLLGLQGGQSSQYYHLTELEHSNLVTGDLSGYATIDFVTGVSGYLQDNIVDLNGYATITGVKKAWNNLVFAWTEIPSLNTGLLGGDVYNYVYGDTTYYRFVPEPYFSTGDIFYSFFSGTVLQNPIATRGEYLI